MRKSYRDLFIEKPATAKEAYTTFGWARGELLDIEGEHQGLWQHWMTCIAKGRFSQPPDLYELKSNHHSLPFYKKLSSVFEYVRQQGCQISDLLEWMCFALGIAWCKELKIRYNYHEHFYNNLDLSCFIKEPSDYLSLFLCEFGHSGVADYFPTPLDLTKLINMITQGREEEVPTHGLQYEPCMGTAPMLLTAPSWNQMGIDLVKTCVMASCIHAFFYKPSLLYCPEPLYDMHLCDEGIYSYFEFDTNTRIYHGDSIFGELTAPKDIFSQDTELIDVYYQPYDLSLNDKYHIQHFRNYEWNEIGKEDRFRIIKAYARDHAAVYPTSNPPFSMNWANNKKRMEEIDKKNELFIFEMKEKDKAYQEAASSNKGW
jgi:hypothetical protein